MRGEPSLVATGVYIARTTTVLLKYKLITYSLRTSAFEQDQWRNACLQSLLKVQYKSAFHVPLRLQAMAKPGLSIDTRERTHIGIDKQQSS